MAKLIISPEKVWKSNLQPLAHHAKTNHFLIMGAAEALVGEVLKGSRHGLEWTIVEKISQDEGFTPGAFSIGYKVTSSDGRDAFLKASDLSMASANPDPVKALREATTAHEFERSILEHCQGNRLDRIVTAIDFGASEVVHMGVRDLVFFIVFELARGDLRKFVLSERTNDLLWHISTTHNLAVAINQLHSADICHNDFKPANTLVFDDIQKVSDMGRATSPHFQAIHEEMLCAGDKRFAPPEQLYAIENPADDVDKFLRSKAGDLYNLGSIFHYLMTQRSITPQIINRLPSVFRPKGSSGGWCDSYESALPHWRQFYNAVMTEFYDDMPHQWTENYKFALDEIYKVIIHLCEPDFRLRGDMTASQVSISKYSLSKIISRLDLIRSRIMVIANAR